MLDKIRAFFYNNIGIHFDGVYWYRRYEDYYEDTCRLDDEVQRLRDELGRAEDSIMELKSKVILLTVER